MPSIRRCRRRISLALAVSGVIAGAAAPQAFAQFAREGSPLSTVADQPTVYVRDSAIAADKFELGKRMERLKEWHKSADVYQEILE